MTAICFITLVGLTKNPPLCCVLYPYQGHEDITATVDLLLSTLLDVPSNRLRSFYLSSEPGSINVDLGQISDNPEHANQSR